MTPTTGAADSLSPFSTVGGTDIRAARPRKRMQDQHSDDNPLPLLAPRTRRFVVFGMDPGVLATRPLPWLRKESCLDVRHRRIVTVLATRQNWAPRLQCTFNAAQGCRRARRRLLLQGSASGRCGSTHSALFVEDGLCQMGGAARGMSAKCLERERERESFIRKQCP